MGMDINLGVLLPTTTALWGDGAQPRDLIDFGIRAERLGFGSLWVNDSLVTPRIETLTMLAALAPVTSTVTLGTATLLPVLRRPVQAAQQIASVDLLSDGRLVLGVGAGFPGRFGQPLHEWSQVPWPRRFARLDETVALWRQLWSGGAPGDFHGELLSFDDLPASTPAYRPGGPPIWLGGASPGALARAGRHYDGWLPYPPDPEVYASGLARVRAVAADAARPAVSAGLFSTVLVAADPVAGAAGLDEYARTAYGMPLVELRKVQSVVTGTLAQVRADLGRYVAAGARTLVLRVGTLGVKAQLDQLEALATLRW
jgi:alkanesulfonate monooxygenase SsuD/methylene tetrahydromethanopterin reductase-like flavin-dependent oxidoreductase (luciferase family)